jgi:phosphoacetylglucosamine mutase
VLIDCANGVGAQAAEKFAAHLGDVIPFILHNTATTTPGALNHDCGADFVKTQQRLPPSLTAHIKPGQRACSLDGDADRLMYFYLDDRGQFRMLDGDKIGTLVAAFIGELVTAAGLEHDIKVGIVQTAYANGASTAYLSKVRLL